MLIDHLFPLRGTTNSEPCQGWSAALQSVSAPRSGHAEQVFEMAVTVSALSPNHPTVKTHNSLFPLSPIKWITFIKPPLENGVGLLLWNMWNKKSKFVSRRLTVTALQTQGCLRCTSCCSLSRPPSVYSSLWKAAVPPVFLVQSVQPSSVMEADMPCHFILTFWKAVWFFVFHTLFMCPCVQSNSQDFFFNVRISSTHTKKWRHQMKLQIREANFSADGHLNITSNETSQIVIN